MESHAVFQNTALAADYFQSAAAQRGHYLRISPFFFVVLEFQTQTKQLWWGRQEKSSTWSGVSLFPNCL